MKNIALQSKDETGLYGMICIVQVVTMDQPAADFLISIVPGVRQLVEAAVSQRP